MSAQSHQVRRPRIRALSAPAAAEAPAAPSFYVVLFLLTAVVSIAVIMAGKDEDPQPEIAGGYDVTEENACLGDKFDLKQSGQFVNLGVPNQDTPPGKLRFEDGKDLTGDVELRRGRHAGDRGRASRTSGSRAARRRAVRQREEARPARRRHARTRASRAASRASTSSRRARTASGGTFEIEEAATTAYEFRNEEAAPSARSSTTTSRARRGRDRLPRRGRARRRAIGGTAADRTINLTSASRAPTRARAPAGATRGDDRATATEAARVVRPHLRRLLHRGRGGHARRAPVRHRSPCKLRQPRVMGEVVAGITLGPTILGAIAPGRAGGALPVGHPPVHRGRRPTSG